MPRAAQVRLQAVALRRQHREQVIHVAGVELGGHGDARAPRAPRDSAAAIARRRSVQPREKRQARAQDRRLQLVEAAVHAGLDVVIARRLAAVAQPLDARRPARASLVVDRAAVAERAEVLGRVEAERAGDADRADRPPVARSPGAPGTRPRRSPGRAARRRARCAVMSAGWPYRCTGRIARVRDVTAAADRARDRASAGRDRCRRTPAARRPS